MHRDEATEPVQGSQVAAAPHASRMVGGPVSMVRRSSCGGRAV